MLKKLSLVLLLLCMALIKKFLFLKKIPLTSPIPPMPLQKEPESWLALLTTKSGKLPCPCSGGANDEPVPQSPDARRLLAGNHHGPWWPRHSAAAGQATLAGVRPGGVADLQRLRLKQPRVLPRCGGRGAGRLHPGRQRVHRALHRGGDGGSVGGLDPGDGAAPLSGPLQQAAQSRQTLGPLMEVTDGPERNPE